MSELTEGQMKAENELLQSRSFSSSSLAALLSFWMTYRTTTRLTKKFKARYRAATVAFMAGGMWDDGQQDWPHGAFHPHFFESRAGTISSDARKANRRRVFETALDMLTALDRVSGGATIMLHIDGNQKPGSPHVPEAVKADVYITPHIKQENPDGEVFVAQVAQAFIESIAVPSIQRWEGAMGNRLRSSRTHLRAPPHYNYMDPPPLIPAPNTPTSSIYTICGRPVGALDDAIAKHNPFRPVQVSNSTGTSNEASLQSMLESLRNEHAKTQSLLEETKARVAELEAKLIEKDALLNDAVCGLSAIQAKAGQLQTDLTSRSTPNTSTPRATQSSTYEQRGSNASAHFSSAHRPHGASTSFVRTSSPASPSPARPAQTSSSDHLSASFIPDSPKLFRPACEATIKRFGMLTYVHNVLWDYHERLHHTQWHFHMMQYLELEKEEADALTVAMHTDRGLEFDPRTCISSP
ncbi:hypothetical protein BC835DRAFT_1422324 [Cytidiella melzeri]|nr:hypothetical protein BC835DRAFT_1422324 [Cytidiella melzeri]